MKAVVLAGGRGTRLAPYTTILPKPLMPLGNHPILEIIIKQLRDSGFTEVTLAVGYLSHLLEAYFGDGQRFGIKIRYSHEDKPLGTAGPLTLIPGLNEPFLVLNGDLLTNLDFREFYNYHVERDADLTVSLYPKTVQISLGVLEIDPGARVTNYTEKPTYSYLASMGIYVISPCALALLRTDQYCDLPDLVKGLLQSGGTVVGRVFEGDWFDIGRPDDYQAAAQYFQDQVDWTSLPVVPQVVPQVLPPMIPAIAVHTNGY